MIREFSFLLVLACRAVSAICFIGIAGCVGVSVADGSPMSRMSSIAPPPHDGKCAVFSGEYRETGDGRYSSGETFVGHLMGNAFAKSFYDTNNAAARDALFVRVSQKSGTVRMEAMVRHEIFGTSETGEASGWYCSQGRLVKYSAIPFHIEAGSGTQIELHTLFIAADRSLCRTKQWAMDYVFGGTRGGGYAYTVCYPPLKP